MAQINEYTPETNAQGAVGGVSPNLEAVSLFGRGVEHVGAALEEAGAVIHRREAQQEVSEVYGQFAQARANWNVTLKQRLKDGTLDPDKFDQEYASFVNKAGESVKTAEGKDFFNRQANRLGATLMQNAIIGKAQVDGEKAYQDISQGVNVHIANLFTHPDQAPDAIDATHELIAAKQKDGTLNPEQAIRLQKEMIPQLAEAAVKGFSDQDPGKDESGAEHANLGKQFLDKGGFAEYLNEPQRAALYRYADQADNRRRIDGERAETTAHRLLEKQGQNYMDTNANRVLNGSYSLKELQSAPLTFQQKEYIQAKVRAQNAQEVATDPRRFTNVYNKVIHGDITSRDQLVAEFDKGGLAPSTMDHLMHEIDSTPEGHLVKGMQKTVDKDLQGLRFKGAGGAYTTAGDVFYTNAQTAIYQARQQANAQGITDRQYYSNTNPKDPTSWVAIKNQFLAGMTDRASIGANEAMGKATDQDYGTMRFSTSPTKEIPPKAEPAPPPSVETPKTAPSDDLGFIKDSLGLTESPEAKQRRLKGEAAFKAKHPGYVPSSSPKESMWKPGESAADVLKRLGK